MTVKHLDHLNLSVTDLKASIAWYGRVFGFEPVEWGVYQGAPWTIIKGGDAMLCMYEHPERGQMSEEARNKARVHGISHFALRITDAEAWEQTLRRERITPEHDGVIQWNGSRSWYVYDPSGYEIEVALWNDDEISFSAA